MGKFHHFLTELSVPDTIMVGYFIFLSDMLTVLFHISTGAKVTDVFVTIALGKEKFQTSTIKYGGKVQNSVEWFEECDL